MRQGDLGMRGIGIVWRYAPLVLLLASSTATAGENDECNIKGNVNTRGERIYHVPGDRYYDETKIVANHGERWFCSEKEAKAAGWRHAKV
jgi:hypothetical protein